MKKLVLLFGALCGGNTMFMAHKASVELSLSVQATKPTQIIKFAPQMVRPLGMRKLVFYGV